MICRICGKEFEKSIFTPSLRLCSSECHSIDFWNQVLDDEAIIIDGECYHGGGYVENPVDKKFLGFGGRVYKIRFKKDGKEIITNNLWYNGEIPKERNIEDNAEFIKEVKNNSVI